MSLDSSPTKFSIAVDDGDIAITGFGSPAAVPDIVFLHANGFNGQCYAEVLAPLGAGHWVLAIDLRGHGRTTLPTSMEGHRWQIFADDLLPALQKLGGMPRVLAGHSMGATSCLLACAGLTEAQLPQKLVLFDPVIAPPAFYNPDAPPDHEFPLARLTAARRMEFPDREAAFAQYRGRGAFRSWPDQVLRDYLSDGLLPNAQGGVSLACAPAWEALNFASAARSDPYPALVRPEIARKTQIFKAAENSTFNPKLDALAPGVTVTLTEGSSHFLPMEHPEVVRCGLELNCP